VRALPAHPASRRNSAAGARARRGAVPGWAQIGPHLGGARAPAPRRPAPALPPERCALELPTRARRRRARRGPRAARAARPGWPAPGTQRPTCAPARAPPRRPRARQQSERSIEGGPSRPAAVLRTPAPTVGGSQLLRRRARARPSVASADLCPARPPIIGRRWWRSTLRSVPRRRCGRRRWWLP